MLLVLGPDDSEERWPNEPPDPGAASEPDEADALEDLGHEPPSVDIPQPPDPSEVDVPEELARSFWKLVAIFNVALFALALGPMLAVFRGEYVTGGGVFLFGAAWFGYGYLLYRRQRRRLDRNG